MKNYTKDIEIHFCDASYYSSVAQSCLTLCDPMGCSTPGSPVTSLFPGVCSNSCPLSQRCHPTISSSAAAFSFCPQSFQASQSFPVSWLFASGSQSIGASASAAVPPMNIQSWFPKGLTGLISLQSKGLSRVFSSTKYFPPFYSRSVVSPPWTVQCGERNLCEMYPSESWRISVSNWRGSYGICQESNRNLGYSKETEFYFKKSCKLFGNVS